jgi:hypothetical protein
VSDLLNLIREEIPARVARGATALDEFYGPSWVDEIDLDALSLKEFGTCVIGQLAGIHSEKTDVLSRYDDQTGRVLKLSPSHDLNEFWNRETRHGFSLDASEMRDDRWEVLDAAWRDLIGKRRGDADVAAPPAR